MLIPATEVLSLPSFRAAEARVVSGDPDALLVRWVHSSEVFEMGSLLAGGELLLTTGLGLHGRSNAQLEEYVDALADAGCMGLGLELGRSFLTLPEAMAQAAERRGLLLVVMERVVPFERMVEDFHDVLLRKQLGSTRAGESVWRDLLAVVLAGDGLRALLDTISRLVRCEVEFRDSEGSVVERSRIMSTRGRGTMAVEVRGRSGPRGTLVLHTEATRRATSIAERAATAVGLELARQPDIGLRPTLAQSLITDLCAGVLTSGEDVTRRLREAALAWPTAGQLLVACADPGQRVP
ncbi:MAG: PucR family transcriptional regulator ligand-binding domain-containing protein, partial [Nocardioides sp.]